jgi:translation initiation factor 2 subunit 3
MATPGSLIGVGAILVPELCRGDRLVGQVVGLRGTLPPVFSTVTIHFKLLNRAEGPVEYGELEEIRTEVLMVNVGSAATLATVDRVKGKEMTLILTSPVCTDVVEKITLSRRVQGHWRLIG